MRGIRSRTKVALDRKERLDIVRGNRRAGRHQPLKREVRRGGCGQFTLMLPRSSFMMGAALLTSNKRDRRVLQLAAD